MKALLVFFPALLLACSASADYTLEIVIESGPGLQRLAQLCGWVRDEATKPEMTNDECCERIFLRGAFELNHEKALQSLRAAGGVALAEEDAQFWADLPMPADGEPPEPTPTSSPTSTPTATPKP